MIRQLLPAAMAAALVLAGCNRGEDASATASETAETVVTVGPENVAIANLAELRSGPTISGSLEPEQLATVRSEVSGSVLRTFVEAGERVRRGQLLANLDERAIEEGFLSSRSAVRSAESALSLARRNLQRTERLTQAGALPERDLETARLDVTNAEGALADARARLAAAQEQLEDTRVRAPFDGIVSERQVDAGDVVQVGAALFTIVDPRRLRLEASGPGGGHRAAQGQGTEVEFSVSGFDRRITGQIDRINPVVDSDHPPGPDLRGDPQSRADAGCGSVRRGSGRNRHQARRGGANHRGRQPRAPRRWCTVIKDGRVAESEVQTGVRDEAAELVEIQAGVPPGDTVLLGSAQGVTPGSRVRVLQEEARTLMFISDFAIQRPIVTVTAMVALVVFGIAALLNLHTDEFPDIQQPIVGVTIVYPGASPGDGRAGDRRPDRGGVLHDQRRGLVEHPGQRDRRPGAVHRLLRLREGHPGGVAGHPRRHLHQAGRPARRRWRSRCSPGSIRRSSRCSRWRSPPPTVPTAVAHPDRRSR